VRASTRGLGDGQDLSRGVGHDLRRVGLAPFLCPGHRVERERERVRPAAEGEHAVHDRVFKRRTSWRLSLQACYGTAMFL
jgi:hypothetical protein